jgi:hypothetical protein
VSTPTRLRCPQREPRQPPRTRPTDSITLRS